MTIRLMRFLAIFAFGLAGVQGASAQTFVEASGPIVGLVPAHLLINTVIEYGTDGSFVTRVGARSLKGLKSLTVTFDAGIGAHVFTVNGAATPPKPKMHYPVVLSYLVDQQARASSDRFPLIDADRTLTIKVHTIDAAGQAGDTTYFVHALASTLTVSASGLLSMSASGGGAAKLYEDSTKIASYPGTFDIGNMAVASGGYTLVAVAPNTSVPSIANGCPPNSLVMICNSVTVSAGSPTNPPSGTFYLPVQVVFDNSVKKAPTGSFSATGHLTSQATSGGATSFIATQPDTPIRASAAQQIPEPSFNVAPPVVGPLAYGAWTITATSPQAGTITCTANYGPGMAPVAIIQKSNPNCY